MRRIFFWTHFTIGLSVGLFILVMAATGALLTYERQVVAAVRNTAVHEAPGAKPLSLDALADAAVAAGAVPGNEMTIPRNRSDVVKVAKGRNDTVLLDPYTGEVLPDASKGVRAFFSRVEAIHRWFAFTGKRTKTGEFIKNTANLIFALGRFITLNIYLRQREESKVQPNFVVGIDRIETLLNVIAVLISLMLAFGIRPLEFLTSITIVAAAIALLTKDYITNIVNGLIMMFSDQLEIGDKIQVGRHVGFIRDITLINLVLKNDSGEIILIPNLMALTTDVVNFSKNNTHQVIFDSEISSKNEVHLDQLEDQLMMLLEKYSETVFKEGAQLNVIERKADSLLIRFQFPIKTGEKPIEIQVKKEVNQVLINWIHELRKA
ncbi:MAG: hypothetical protein B7Z16_08275 [Algoriphagus sp. 32-45-6]|nr:MAG: hypothetical protein B7Z16_08275 [Algoriphagus sp. 32-45-6]